MKGKGMKKKIIWSIIIIGLFYLLIINIEKAHANDPLPEYSYGQEVKRIESARGQSQADWEKTDAYKAFSCPEGTSGGLGVDMAFTTDPKDDFYYAYCWKSYREIVPVSPSESTTVVTAEPTPTPSDTPTATVSPEPTPTTTTTSTTSTSSSTTSSTTSNTTTTTSSLYDQIMALFQQLFALLAKFIK